MSSPPPTSMVLLLLLAGGCTAPSSIDVDSPDWSAGPLVPTVRFVVIADPHVTTEGGENADRLDRAVAWINEHAESDRLDLVLVLGDIAWAEGFSRAKTTLDTLTIPYVPINGDNEVQAIDEGTFAETFADQYRRLGETLDGWTLNPTAIHDLDADRDTWLHNMAFTFAGVRFVGLDWASRQIGGPESEMGMLHDYDGGTMPFLRDELDGAAAGRPREAMVLFSHIPMHVLGFDLVQAQELSDTIGPVRDTVWANLAGHYHFDGEETEEAGYDVIVTDATWDDVIEVRVVSGSVNEETWAWSTEIVVVE